MDVLILGGESPRHYDWVRRVADQLTPDFVKVVFLDYRHWSLGGQSDVPYEVTEAAELAKTLGEYVIVAKSIGTVISTLGIAAGVLQPRRCVFMGLPLGAAEQTPGLAPGLRTLPPTIIIQHEQDPLGSAKMVAAWVAQFDNQTVEVLAVPGETHDYTNFEQIAKLAKA